jgi:PAS domain S-box-containing protein
MRTRLFNPSLAARVMLGAAALVAVCAIGLVYLIVEKGREAYLADRGATLTNQAQRSATRFVLGIDSVRRDILVLTHLPPVQGILRATRNQGMDPEKDVPIEFWQTRLPEIFSAFAEANPDYFQIRYIGVAANGRELVRVDATDGRVTVTPPEKLQSVGDSDYFQAALKLHTGEVYLSEINLDQESGRIRVPHLRTLRAATPVFTPDGDLFGMIVINVDVGPAIEIITTHLPPGVQGYLVNSEGDYLAHPDPSRIFGFDQGKRYTLQQDMPGLQVPSTPGAGRQSLQTVAIGEGFLHLAIERVQFDPRVPEHSLLLAYALPDALVEAEVAGLRNAAAAAVAGIALLLLGMVVLGVYRAFAPLTRLTALAEQIGAGHYDVKLPAEGVGELGSFIRAFRGMLDGIGARERAIEQSAAELQVNEERLRLLVDGVKDYAIIMLDPGGHVVTWNEGAQRLNLYAEAEIIGHSMECFYSPEDIAAGTPARLLALAAAEGHCEDQGWRVRKDGARFYADVVLSALHDTAGRLVSFAKITRDVTERKEAERRIRGQLEHLNLLDHITRAIGERQDLRSIFQVVVRSLEDSLPTDFGCVCLYDPAANALRVTCVGAKSETLAHELTIEEGAAIDVDDNGLGRCVQGQLVYEPDIGEVRFAFPERLARSGLRSLVMAPLRSESRVFGVLVAARRAARGFSSVECEFLRQLSEHVALAAHQAQLYGALQQAYDDLRQTQQAMLQEERLRALGQMASGIAHDINNALSPVSLYAESMLETERNLSDRGRGYLETIQRAVEDVAQTVARMREFYRQRETQLVLTPVQMNSIVQQVVDLTRARWSDMPQQRGIMIRALTELLPDLPKIMGSESEIREALTNLVFNAVDAMPEGGTLTLRTRLADAPDAQRAAVVVEVADSGIGMNEDTRQRCLEPFFTTKGERGTGLGLAMVFGMVQRHSADLEIDSAPGAGTTMRLVFAVPPALPAEPGRPAPALEPPSRLRLLLIDDDPILLKSLCDTLETDGHVIVTANGGKEGIAMLQASLARGEPFAAVITDLGMPYLDGRRVAAAVKEASPATPVILLTGWGQRLAAEGDIPPHVDRVLAKPPKLRELREALGYLCRPAAAEIVA